MKQEWNEEREFELLDRFDRKKNNGKAKDEAPQTETYQWMRDAVHQLPIPPIDTKPVLAAIQKELSETSRPENAKTFIHSLFIQPKRIALAACVVLMLASGISFTALYQQPLVQNIVLESNDGTRLQPTWFWKLKAIYGFTIRVPKDVSALVTLQDQSQVECKPGTMISFKPDSGRFMRLQRGEVTIHAVTNPQNPMIVSTALGNVEVKGTVFHVRILE